jgi:anti-anti-sigma factor
LNELNQLGVFARFGMADANQDGMNADIFFIIRTESLRGKALSTFRKDLGVLVGKNRRVVLDLSSVEAVDSFAASVLADMALRLSAQGGSLRLVGLKKQVAAFFELLRLSNLIESNRFPVPVISMPLAA